jgi:hypothetical protein
VQRSCRHNTCLLACSHAKGTTAGTAIRARVPLLTALPCICMTNPAQLPLPLLPPTPPARGVCHMLHMLPVVLPGQHLTARPAHQTGWSCPPESYAAAPG